MTDYQRIEQAIQYIQQHFRVQPSLEAVAAELHLSPFHFQRLFTDWAGVSPKKFLQYVTLDHAKRLLIERRWSLTQVAWESGLSGSSRLHDLFVGIEAMTPHEYRNGGEHLSIRWGFYETDLGGIVVAATEKGVCDLQFVENETEGGRLLRAKYPNARLEAGASAFHAAALPFFKHTLTTGTSLKLHLRGTDFQLKVWEALLRIPESWVTTYGDLAQALGQPGASRAVGAAVGDNPVAGIIPCHRVIRKSGIFGEYHWGAARKTAMLALERCRGERPGQTHQNLVF